MTICGTPLRATALVASALSLLGARSVDAQDGGRGAESPAGRAAPAGRDAAVRLATSTGELAGTLLMPTRAAPVPLVVIVGGSGPTDRDGNSALTAGANNSLRLLAEGLAERGVASVRYDKRGVGESRAAGPAERDLRFDTYADDAAAWVRHFREDARFGAVAVLGHSEGSLLGMLATQRGKADGLVSIAGIGRPAQRLIHDQLAPQLPADLMAQADRVLDTLAAGREAADAPRELAALFRPSAQPYMISWFRYDPAAEIARLTVPVLVAHGATDAQVAPAEAERLAAAQPRARLLIVPGMNHVLKTVPADVAAQRRSYGDPTLPVAPALLDGVAAFVHGLRRER